MWSNFHEHGFAIAPFCLWLIWRDREQLVDDNGEPVSWVLLPLVGLSMLWMLSVAISVQVIHLALAPVILLLWLWALRGNAAFFAGIPIVMIFMIAVPIWEVFLIPLQKLTVLVNQLALSLTSIKAEVTGTEIHLPAGIIEVARSCAGLNYFQSGLALGAMYALTFSKRWRTQIKIILVAVGLSLVSNWIRVFGLVIIGHVTEMRAHLLKAHGTYGWVIFALTIPVFGFIARKIEKHDEQALTHGKEQPLSTLKRLSPPSVTMPVLATGAALSGPVLLFALQSLSSPGPLPANIIGLTPSAQWAAQATVADSTAPNSSSWTSGLSGFTQHKQYIYTHEATVVQVDRYVFASQDQDAEMISDGNRLAPDSLILNSRLVGPLDNTLRMVREAVVVDNGNARLVWSWYRAGGMETPSGRKAELLEFWGLISGSPPSETILVSTACSLESCTAARAALFEVVTGKPMPTSSSNK